MVSGKASSVLSGQWFMYCIIDFSINEKSQRLDCEETGFKVVVGVEVIYSEYSDTKI